MGLAVQGLVGLVRNGRFSVLGFRNCSTQDSADYPNDYNDYNNKKYYNYRPPKFDPQYLHLRFFSIKCG